jgi:ERCC4-type nuclease
MEDKGELILGRKRTKFRVFIDENIERGKILFNPEDFKEFIEPIPTKEELEKILASIKGIGEKLAEEICEEYNTIEGIIEAIDSGKFRVGGIDKKRMELIKGELEKW